MIHEGNRIKIYFNMNIRNDRFLYQYLFIRKGVKLIDEEIMKNQQKKKK